MNSNKVYIGFHVKYLLQNLHTFALKKRQEIRIEIGK